ncbi:F-box/kelch-repeat protein [Cardamine amara subsp. amara]|uniref:F-box/kelch-repeat protein n=1 Tax=Cardamine amara subsp. amara TaxID=228776 RepID=A0ABD0ZIH0_CARAN
MSPPPGKKRKTKTKTKTPGSTLNSLPDDLLLDIVARVSRLYYPTLSHVSKRFRSLIASPELYKARSRLGKTESCLYLCLRCCYGYRWFNLCWKPDQTLTHNTCEEKMKKKTSDYVLAKVQIRDSPPADFSTLVSVGSDIYNIPGSANLSPPSSEVSILDCRSHTWREGPSLRMELYQVSASVLDRKIYVAGRCEDGESDYRTDSFNVLDIETQVWDPEPIPCSVEKIDFYCCRSTCFDGKFKVVSFTQRGFVAYDPKEARWDMVEPMMIGCSYHMFKDSYCEIDHVLYCSVYGVIKWYDPEVRMWIKLKGLEGLRRFPNDVRLADYGGKLAVLWDRDFPCDCDYEKMIWCAEISLERSKSCEIWGKVEWFDHVRTVPQAHEIVKILAATV